MWTVSKWVTTTVPTMNTDSSLPLSCLNYRLPKLNGIIIVLERILFNLQSSYYLGVSISR